MKTVGIALISVFVVACGGSNNGGIKTAEERLDEQLAIAEAQQPEQDSNLSQYDEAATDSEEANKFNKEAAKHELKRAGLNAVDCPNTFEKAQLGDYQPGKAVVTLTFENAGTVKDVSVSSPYAGTPVGECIVRAMGTVAIDPYQDPEVTTTWELEMGPAKPTDAKSTGTKKK